jgi:hypothetical protein
LTGLGFTPDFVLVVKPCFWVWEEFSFEELAIALVTRRLLCVVIGVDNFCDARLAMLCRKLRVDLSKTQGILIQKTINHCHRSSDTGISRLHVLNSRLIKSQDKN